MKKWKKRFLYIFCAMVLLVVAMFKVNSFLNEKDQEQAFSQVQYYLEDHYPNLNYSIQSIDSSTDFKHYGYFKHAVTVQNIDTKESFTVFYDKRMNRMEDSINLKEQEEYLTHEIQPKIEQYVAEQFGETRYISVDYDLNTGYPTILVKFNTNYRDITQAEFDAFVTYLKEALEIDHANVIVDYWMKALTFNENY